MYFAAQFVPPPMSSALIIVGVIVMVYCIAPLVVGLLVQMRACKQDKEMYGVFPGIALVFHALISIFFIAACFADMYELAVVGVVFYCIKIVVMLLFQKELKAFRNMRSTQETDQFLQSLRQKTPQAWFHVECYHMETHVYRDSNGHMQTEQEKVVTFRHDDYV